MFNAVYINFSECYGLEGSLPLRQALEELLGTEDVCTYRSDGFVTVHCPVTDESYFLYDGCAVTRGPDGSVIILEDIEPFRQEVSDAVELSIDRSGHDGLRAGHINEYLGRFIITKPDPLTKVLNEISHEGGYDSFDHYAHRLRAALEARGLEIREKNDDR